MIRTLVIRLMESDIQRSSLQRRLFRKLCLSRSIVEAILVDFGMDNGSKLAPRSAPKPILALKRKHPLNTSSLVPNWVQGLEVGGKNRTKIDEKMKSKREGVLGSIFHRFWWPWEA